ncbi:hypothetical protein VCRA2133E348_340005 [Vibrio crassostreae]|nr:hypothetical protein VCRA2133E348_340005 [Vibrio crassostreae]
MSFDVKFYRKYDLYFSSLGVAVPSEYQLALFLAWYCLWFYFWRSKL